MADVCGPPRPSRSATQRGPQIWPPLAAGALAWCLLGVAWAADEAYLDAVAAEATKVEAGPATAGTGAAPAAASDAQGAFEQELDQRFHGTYLFYKRLPPQSREELAKQYEGGSSMEEIRQAVMSRFLNKR